MTARQTIVFVIVEIIVFVDVLLLVIFDELDDGDGDVDDDVIVLLSCKSKVL